MPRNNLSKYTLAFEVVTEAAQRWKVGHEVISKILIEAINENRVRIHGTLLFDIGESSKGQVPRVPSTKGSVPKPISREFFMKGVQIQPAQYGLGVIKYPSVCDEQSNIFIYSNKNKAVKIIVAKASLLTSDVARVLSKTFVGIAPGTPPGVRRSDSLWGEVILHLLDLQGRKAHGKFETTELLVDSVVDAHPDINPSSIRPVLNFVVKRLKS